MALLYFDGFETYGVVPTSSTATGVHSSATTANGWSGAAQTTTTSLNIARPPTALDPDRRTWISTLSSAAKPSSTTMSIPYNASKRTFTIVGDTMVVGCKIIAADVAVSGANYALGLIRIGFGLHAFDIMLGGTNGPGGAPGSITIGRLVQGNPALELNNTPNPGTASIGLSSWNKAVANTLEVSVNKTTGLITVWVNNAYVGTYTNAPGTVTYAPAIVFGEWSQFGSTSANVSLVYATDVYVVDSAGALPNSRLGKVKVVTRVPTGDVLATFARPSGASTNASVAGQIPPSASNFLTGIADGDTDLYSSSAFAFSNESIIATAIMTSGFKTDATGNDVEAALSIGGTVYTGPVTTLPVGTAFATAATIFTTNPATGLKFTKAELDAASFGMRVKAPAP